MFQEFQVYEVTLEVNDNGRIQLQRIQAPRVMIEHQFLGLMEQASKVNRPIRIKMSRTEPYFDQYEQKNIPQESNLIFANNSYVSIHSEEFKE